MGWCGCNCLCPLACGVPVQILVCWCTGTSLNGCISVSTPPSLSSNCLPYSLGDSGGVFEIAVNGHNGQLIEELAKVAHLRRLRFGPGLAVMDTYVIGVILV